VGVIGYALMKKKFRFEGGTLLSGGITLSVFVDKKYSSELCELVRKMHDVVLLLLLLSFRSIHLYLSFPSRSSRRQHSHSNGRGI
jgi:hypothetical protein